MNDKESGNKFFKDYIDKNHPLLPKESFNLNLLNSEHYRYNPILTFGRTYKYLTGGNEWRQLILKFEHILMNINFDNAKMYLETEFMGNYEFLWKPTNIKNSKQLQFSPSRNANDSDPLMPNDSEYPIKYNEQILAKFNSKIDELNKLPIGTKFIISNPYKNELWGHDAVRVILTKLQLNNSMEWGYEKEHDKFNLYLIRKREIEKVENAM